MKPIAALRHLLAFAGSSVIAIPSASAVDKIWGGGNLLWNDTSAAGWNGSAPASTDTATINSGTVTFAANDTYGQASTMSSAAITVNTGATLASGSRFNTLWNLTLGGGTLLSNGGVNNGFGTYNLAGTVTASGGVTSSISTGSGSFNIINLGHGSSSALTNTTFNVGSAGTLNVGTVLQDHRYFSGTTVVSTAGLIKNGAGEMKLNAANTYTGGTTVSAGRLLVSNTTGSGTGTGTVSVGASGTLGGTGAISGAVNVTGQLSPGASIETFATGTLSLLDSSTLVHELDSSVATSAGSDLLKVTGNLNLTGTVNLSLTDLALTDVAFAVNNTFSLINYTGTWNGGLFTLDGNELADEEVFSFGLNTWRISYNDATGGLNYTGEYAGGTDSFVNLTAVTIVPEPSTALLGGLGILFLLRRRRTN